MPVKSTELSLRVNQTTHLVAEQHVDFLRFDDSHYFALTESRMRHRLSFSVFARSVVDASGFAGHSGRCFDTAFESAGRRAGIASDFGYSSLFGNR